MTLSCQAGNTGTTAVAEAVAALKARFGAGARRGRARRAIAAGGTATGELGVGIGNRGFLVERHGMPAVALMGTIKAALDALAALDPLNILNPGKVLPDPEHQPHTLT